MSVILKLLNTGTSTIRYFTSYLKSLVFSRLQLDQIHVRYLNGGLPHSIRFLFVSLNVDLGYLL
jgi:hypothetical protein